MIVDTITGQASTGNTRLLRFGGIEDLDLYDGDGGTGVLTDVAAGIYLRATNGVDNLVFFRQTGGVFIKRNGVQLNTLGYAPTNRITAYGRGDNDYLEFNFTLARLERRLPRGRRQRHAGGGPGERLLVGGDGNDTLRGYDGHDLLYGEDQFLKTPPTPLTYAAQRRTGLVMPTR